MERLLDEEDAASSEEPAEVVEEPAPEALVPVPPPVPLALAVVRVRGPRVDKSRVRHIPWDINVRNRPDGLCFLKYDTQRLKLAAHCRHPDHGDTCRLGRALVGPPGGIGNQAQGRPAGYLARWLELANDPRYPDAFSHMKAGRKPLNASEGNFSEIKRIESRAYACDNTPGLADKLADEERLQRMNPSEPLEPEGLA